MTFLHKKQLFGGDFSYLAFIVALIEVPGGLDFLITASALGWHMLEARELSELDIPLVLAHI